MKRIDARCDGAVALVTGASRGIGPAIARRLAEAGARVAITARTATEEPDAPLPGSLARTLEELQSLGAEAVAVPADLADDSARAELVASVEAELGPVDVLVNNAAAAMYAPVASMPLRRARVLFELNVHAPLDLAQRVLPGMRERRRGWIVNLTSRTSAHPSTGDATTLGTTTTLYGASKAALERLTTGLAVEVLDDGIVVTAVAPVRAVRTEGAEALLGGRLDDRPDVFEPVEHLAESVLHLATCDRSWSGRVLTSAEVLDGIGAR